MWYLLAAIIGSSSLVIILKLFDLKGVNLTLGITINYIVGAILAFAFAPKSLGVSGIINAPWFSMSMVIGALFMLSFVVYAISAQRSGVAITTISGRAAVLIPVVFAFTVLGQEVTTLKVSMLVLILLAMFLILKKSKKDGDTKSVDHSKGFSSGAWLIILPVAVFLFNGINDTLVQYAHATMIPDKQVIPLFMGTMFVAGAITGLICFIISTTRKPHTPTMKDMLWGSILGIMNWICMIGVFNGLNYIEGSVFYPLYYTGAIVIATIVGVWLFKERLSPINYLGIVIAVVAITVLSR